MAKPLIYVILGSVREGRRAERVGKWFMSQTAQRTDLEFELIDPKDWPLPFYAEAATPSQHKYTLDTTIAWAKKIEKADGFVLVSPEYNHATSAVMKNMLDTVYAEWNRKPVAFVSYGGISAGGRAMNELSIIVHELAMAPVQSTVMIPFAGKTISEDGVIADDRYNKDAQALLDDLAWWTNALKAARTQSLPTND